MKRSQQKNYSEPWKKKAKKTKKRSSHFFHNLWPTSRIRRWYICALLSLAATWERSIFGAHLGTAAGRLIQPSLRRELICSPPAWIIDLKRETRSSPGFLFLVSTPYSTSSSSSTSSTLIAGLSLQLFLIPSYPSQVTLGDSLQNLAPEKTVIY